MDEPLESIILNTDVKVKIIRWKVAEGSIIYDGRILLIYEVVNEKRTRSTLRKLKSKVVGKVKQLLVKEGDVVDPGDVLLFLEKGCNHPTVINDLCAECGTDLQKDNSKEMNKASVSMIHSIPGLKVSEEQAMILGKADEARLLKDRKLVLLVDLDQTLIHTTNDNVPNNFKDVCHFQLYGPKSPWYHTRLRPNTQQFLSRISEKYELHICTFGSRNYAHMIACFLDPEKKYFSQRILSRDECFDSNKKIANLRALFPCGDNLVCIIDDREDVWEYAPNLIHVKPYHFFQHTGDINAPPGFTKFENDAQLNSEFIHLAQDMASKNLKELKTTLMEIIKTFQSIPSQDTYTMKNVKHAIDIIINYCSPQVTVREGVIPVPPPVGPYESKYISSYEPPSSSDFIQFASRITVKKRNKIRQIVQNIHQSLNNSSDGVVFERRTSRNNSPSSSSTNSTEKSPKSDPADSNTVLEKTNTEDVNEGTQIENGKMFENVENNGQILGDNEIENVKQDQNIENLNEVGKLESMTPKENNELANDIIEKKPENELCEQNQNDKTADVSDISYIKKLLPILPKENQEEFVAFETVSHDGCSSQETEPVDDAKMNDDVAVLTGADVIIGGHVVKTEWDSTPSTDELIELEEQDDYLLYLEEILHKIYTEFYTQYDQCEGMPDLKEIVPKTRSTILQGVKIVFSGVVPNSLKLEDSRPYKVAVSLGAKVTSQLESDTTHLVAVRKGTSKVRNARKRENIYIVTPEWLWMCAERWEKVDERLYPIVKSNLSLRIPPAHCSSPEHSPTRTPVPKQEMQHGRFIDTINPLMSFSSEDIAKMEGEVDDCFNEPESDGEDNHTSLNSRMKKRTRDSTDSTSNSSDDGNSEYKGKVQKKVERKKQRMKEDDDDETIMTKFRRGENLPSDLDFGDNSDRGTEDEVETDGEWNMMGAELEREFLEGDD